MFVLIDEHGVTLDLVDSRPMFVGRVRTTLDPVNGFVTLR